MAQRIPEALIDDIRNQANIVDIIGQYVQLKKSGKNYIGLCPFHNEKTPSFSVNQEKNIFHCFGCGKGGNVFRFLQEIEGVSFPEAVYKTAEIIQFPLENTQLAELKNQPVTQLDTQQQGLLDLHEKAAGLYQHILLNTKAGQPALQYLLDRGMTEELIREFQIGFAPKERILLQEIFRKDHISEDLLSESGLLIRHNDNWLDRFYQRIMFPIRNAKGQIIAFSGRILEIPNLPTIDQPKYLNSPETKLFNKRSTLFNMDKARNFIRKNNEIVLFEGFMDVISAWQAGITHGVASMGTSLTEEQIHWLKRITDAVLICYDGDNAGTNATNRAIQLLEDNGTFDISVVHLPEHLDPDDYIKKYGTSEFAHILTHGRKTVFGFKSEYLKQNRNLANEKDRLEYIDLVLNELAKIPSVIERELNLQKLSEEFQLSEEALRTQLQQVKSRQIGQSLHQTGSFTKQTKSKEQIVPLVYQKQNYSQVEKAERQLLYRILSENNVYYQVKSEPEFQFVHDIYQELYLLFDSYMVAHQFFDLAEFLDYLQEENLRTSTVDIAYMDLAEESTSVEVADCLKVIALSKYQLAIQEKIKAQKSAKASGNYQAEEQLAIEIIQLQRKLKNA